jgi:hypothetical protein
MLSTKTYNSSIAHAQSDLTQFVTSNCSPNSFVPHMQPSIIPDLSSTCVLIFLLKPVLGGYFK